MNDDWLWDGSTPPEEADAHIAAALAGLGRATRECPALPERAGATDAGAGATEAAAPMVGAPETVATDTTAPTDEAVKTDAVAMNVADADYAARADAASYTTNNVVTGLGATLTTSTVLFTTATVASAAPDLLPRADAPPVPTDDLPIANRPFRPTRATVYGALLLAAAAAIFVLLIPREQAWDVAVLAGRSPCDGPRCTLSAGASVETASDGRLALTVGNIGMIELGPETRLARIAAADGHVLDLDAGTIEVAVVAPPRDLRIQTPSAWVVDLGCAYRLSVDDAGTHLSVEDGSVSLENPLGISIVTAGSAAMVTPGSRPDLPLRTDAPAAFGAALREVEATLPAVDEAQLTTLLSQARRQDLLTLWHVVQLISDEQRVGVVARMATLAPSVAVDRVAVQRLDPDALTTLWGALVPVALAR